MCYDKPDVQKIGADELFTLAKELFAQDRSIKIVVSGNSMYPFIRHNRDMVTIAGASYDAVRVSDIVLAFRESEQAYILHRLFKKTPDGFYMVGDHQTLLDGPYPPDALIGVVTEVFRVAKDGSQKKMGGPFYRLLVRLWMWARPVRPFIIKLYLRVRSGKSNG